jgi:toxin ParE1/3/4
MLLISDEARLDIIDAFSCYEVQQVGLGQQFEKCLDEGFTELQQHPNSFQKKYKEVRIYHIHRFPYGVYYLIHESEIKIMGVFHTSRNPQSWVS